MPTRARERMSGHQLGVNISLPRVVSGTLAALRGYVRGVAEKGPIFLRDKTVKAQQSR